MAGYNGIASQYDTYYSTPRDRAENAVLRALAYAEGAPARRVLDLGCGTGLLLDLLDGRLPAAGYLGVDASAAMLERARQKHPAARFLFGDMRQPPALGWDLVWCSFALAQIGHQDAAQAVRRWAEVAHPAARYVVVVPTMRRLRDGIHGPLLPEADRPWTEQVARRVFGPGATVRGLTYLRTGWAWLAQLEHRTRGRLDPDRADYLVITGHFTCRG